MLESNVSKLHYEDSQSRASEIVQIEPRRSGLASGPSLFLTSASTREVRFNVIRLRSSAFSGLWFQLIAASVRVMAVDGSLYPTRTRGEVNISA